MSTFTNQASLSYNNITVRSNVVTGTIADTLSASKTAVNDAYSIGEVITYTVSLVNSGNTELTGLTLTDDLGAYEWEGTQLIPLTYENGSVQYYINGALQPVPAVTAENGLEISGITVPAGGNTMILYQAVPNGFASPEAGSLITNTATVAGQGVTGVTASAEIPADSESVLSISKALDPAEVSQNGQLTYTFVIQNTGNTAESTAVITDIFDPVLSGLKASADGIALGADDYTYNETTGEFVTTEGAFTVPAASYSRSAQSGALTVVPGTVTITVTGTV